MLPSYMLIIKFSGIRANLVQEWLQNCFHLLFLRPIGQDGHKWPLFSIFAAKFCRQRPAVDF